MFFHLKPDGTRVSTPLEIAMKKVSNEGLRIISPYNTDLTLRERFAFIRNNVHTRVI